MLSRGQRNTISLSFSVRVGCFLVWSWWDDYELDSLNYSTLICPSALRDLYTHEYVCSQCTLGRAPLVSKLQHVYANVFVFFACKAIREGKRKECLLFRSTDSMNPDSTTAVTLQLNQILIAWNGNQNVNSPWVQGDKLKLFTFSPAMPFPPGSHVRQKKKTKLDSLLQKENFQCLQGSKKLVLKFKVSLYFSLYFRLCTAQIHKSVIQSNSSLKLQVLPCHFFFRVCSEMKENSGLKKKKKLLYDKNH